MTEGDASEAAWRARAEKTIGGRLDDLAARSADGLDIAPLYARRAADAPRPWRTRPAWAVGQRVDHPDAEAAGRLALAELEGGADALTLVFAGSPFSRGFGLAPANDLDFVLEGVELDLIGLRLDAGTDTLIATRALCALVERRTLTSAALQIDLGFDPIALAARSGDTARFDGLPDILALAEQAGLAGRPLMADGRPWHEAGAGEALELAAVLAASVAYLRRLESAGLSLDAARGAVAVLLAVDADVFLGLAKVRAMRRLWARIETACGLEPKPLRLHAETSWRMMTRRDPWTNVMRATAATFAAGLGGADAITVLPFTLALGLPDEPGRRLARNVQRVLIDEANLTMVDDAAAGAGGFETLTETLCERAWALFQEIEAEGGIEASLAAGALQARCAQAAAARAGKVANLTAGLVGTSRFASLQAAAPAVLDVAANPADPARGNALPCLRDAAPFEMLRDRADAIAARDMRPAVFLATLGSPAAFGPRATWAANFFAAAGVEAETPREERDAGALAESFAASGSRVACLCGTDQAYAGSAAEVTRALRDKGASRLLLAGRKDESWGDIAIDAFVHEGCEALAILEATLDAA